MPDPVLSLSQHVVFDSSTLVKLTGRGKKSATKKKITLLEDLLHV